MADTTLDIGVRGGREAKALVDAITVALRALGQQNAANARQLGQQATAARTEAQNLQLQSKSNADAANRARSRLEDDKRIRDLSIKQAQQEAKSLSDIARQRQTIEAESGRIASQGAAQRVAAAKKELDAVIQAQGQIISAVRAGAAGRVAAAQVTAQADNANTRQIITEARERIRALVAEHNAEIQLAKQRINVLRAHAQESSDKLGDLSPKASAQRRSTLRAEVEARRATLKAVEDEAKAESDARKLAINAARSGLEDVKVIARERAISNKQAVADAKATAKAEITAATQAANVKVREARAVVNAKLEEARLTGKSSADILANGRREIAQARANGKAIVDAARANGKAKVQEASDAVKAANAQVRASRSAANAATQNANQLQRAAARASFLFRQQALDTQKIANAMRALRSTVLQLVAAYAGFRAILGFIATGTKFNQIIESSKLGIAALITAEAQLVDQNGNLLTGTNALAAAQGLAEDQLNKLRVAGIQTAATTEELVTSFQEAVGAGLSVGLTLDQIRKFTVQVAQAGTAINLPFNQLNQEVRSILQGTIDRNSRIAKALQLTNAEVAAAKAQNRLADLLNEKFRAFNVAGAKSVETWAALKSNVADAGQLIAGLTTKPLFEELRVAGLKALTGVFNFEDASIQESFRGLVEGAQSFFKEIGSALADAIAFGVDQAKALSKFFKENREAVKQTAAAVGTMVREFGNMVVQLGNAVLEVVSLGRESNTVLGVARTLSAVFAAIAENARLIVTLLTARALITSLGSILAAVTAIKGAATIATGAATANFAAGIIGGGGAGAAAGSVVPGVGTAIGAIIGTILAATVAMKLFKDSQKNLAAEAARTTTVIQDQTAVIGASAATAVDILRQKQNVKLTKEDEAILDERLSKLTTDFNENLGPAYVKIIQDQTLSIKDKIDALITMQRVQAEGAVLEASNAKAEVDRLTKARDAAQQRLNTRKEQGSAAPFPFGQLARLGDEADLRAFNDQLENAKSKFQVLNTQAAALGLTLQKSLTPAAVIKATTPPGAGGDVVAPQIKKAQGELEVLKAQLDVERAKINAQFAARVIDTETQLEALLQIDLRQIEGERKLIDAQIAEANKRISVIDRGKGTPKVKNEQIAAQRDVIRGLLLQEEALGFQRVELTEKFNGQILKIENDRADEEEEIRIRSLKAQGKELEAALADIALKEKQALRAFDEDNGQRLAALRQKLQEAVTEGLPPEQIERIKADIERLLQVKANVTLAIGHETLEATATALKTELQRILETRTAEVEGIRDRFKQSGKLTDREKQQQSDLIAEANTRALTAGELLRKKIEEIRLAALAKGEDVTIFDLMLRQLDGLVVKSQKVDQELEKIKDTLRSALEEGFGQFISDLTDEITKGNQSITESFKAMVRNVLAEMQKLISTLLAQRLVSALFGIFGGAAVGAASGGQTVGNSTQSMGRAGGGPARPEHGPLRGGSPGVDSIPILAQEDEWFLRRQARWKYGDKMLKAINDLTYPVDPLMSRTKIIYSQTRHFAQGGPVNVPTAARESLPQMVHVQVGVDAQGLLRVWAGPVGRKVVLDTVKANPRQIGHLIDKTNRRPK